MNRHGSILAHGSDGVGDGSLGLAASVPVGGPVLVVGAGGARGLEAGEGIHQVADLVPGGIVQVDPNQGQAVAIALKLGQPVVLAVPMVDLQVEALVNLAPDPSSRSTRSWRIERSSTHFLSSSSERTRRAVRIRSSRAAYNASLASSPVE